MRLLFSLLLFCFFIFSFPTQAVPGLSQSTTSETLQIEHENIFLKLTKPLRKKLIQWQILINREIPKHMKNVKEHQTPLVILSAGFLAFLYGIFHTLGPGHGKTVVATYFLTHGTHIWRGIFVGAQVALSHVGGAIILVLFSKLIMHKFVSDPEAQAYWLKLISYNLILIIGLSMLFFALKHAFGFSTQKSLCSHCNHHHHHEHHQEKHSLRETLLSWGIGAVPCTGSLLILLYAMANNILWIGLIMVLCVALGMALTMTIIGIICIIGKHKVIDKKLSNSQHAHKGKIALEILGALFITSIGALLLSTILI